MRAWSYETYSWIGRRAPSPKAPHRGTAGGRMLAHSGRKRPVGLVRSAGRPASNRSGDEEYSRDISHITRNTTRCIWNLVMQSHLPAGNCRAVVFATTADGLRLPVIDVTHPAFLIPDDPTSLAARRDAFLAWDRRNSRIRSGPSLTFNHGNPSATPMRAVSTSRTGSPRRRSSAPISLARGPQGFGIRRVRV
jgi:hypothetical protein